MEPHAANAEGRHRCKLQIKQFKSVLSGSMQEPALESYLVPKVGDCVEITGTRGRPDLNGARGRVIMPKEGGSECVDNAGRVYVRITGQDIHGAPTTADFKIKSRRLYKLPQEKDLVRPPSSRADSLPDLRAHRSTGSSSFGLRKSSSSTPSLAADVGQRPPPTGATKPEVVPFVQPYKPPHPYARLYLPEWGGAKAKEP